MARSYAKLLTSIWRDPDFTAMAESPQRLYLLLISQPQINGCGVVPYLPTRWAGLASNTKPAALRRSIDELVGRRFIVVDEATEEVWVRSFLRHDGAIRTPQLRPSIWRDLTDVASPSIRCHITDELTRLGHPPLDPSADPSPDPSPDGSPSEPADPSADPPLDRDGVRVHQHRQPSPSAVDVPPPVPPPAAPQAPANGAAADHPPPDDDDVLTAACKTLAGREADRHDDIGNRQGWINARAISLARQHADAAHQAIAQHPDLTAAQLVAYLDGSRPADPDPHDHARRLAANVASPDLDPDDWLPQVADCARQTFRQAWADTLGGAT